MSNWRMDETAEEKERGRAMIFPPCLSFFLKKVDLWRRREKKWEKVEVESIK